MANVSSLSQKGRAAILGHEGWRSVAYLDPATPPVLTIGYGFTMLNPLIKEFWLKTRGRTLVLGDRMTKAEGADLFSRVVSENFEPSIKKAFPNGLPQEQWDAVTSMVYNCGPRALKWRWAQALQRGDVKEAARLLRTTATTAGGRQLKGLIRRRKEEAAILEFGIYPGEHTTPDDAAHLREENIEIQTMLNKVLGLNLALDGKVGPATRKAITTFQQKNPPLVVDGICGQATFSTLLRAYEELVPPAPKSDGKSFFAALLEILSKVFK